MVLRHLLAPKVLVSGVAEKIIPNGIASSADFTVFFPSLAKLCGERLGF